MNTTVLIFAKYIPSHCARNKAVALNKDVLERTGRSQTLYLQQVKGRGDKDEWAICKVVSNKNDPSVAIAASMGIEIAEVDLTNAWHVTV